MASRIDDMMELSQVAIGAIASALHDGDRDHTPGSWRDESPGNNFNHLQLHLSKLLNAIDFEPSTGDSHLDHLICRVVMIKALRLKKTLKEMMIDVKTKP